MVEKRHSNELENESSDSREEDDDDELVPQLARQIQFLIS